MSTAPPDIFSQLAAHDTSLQQHDQTVAQSGDVFDQLAKGEGKIPAPPPPVPQTGGAGMNAALNNPAIKDLEQGNVAAPGAAGMIEGGRAAASGGAAALNSALKYLGFGAKAAEAAPAVNKVASGIVDQYGQPFMKLVQSVEPEVQPMMHKILTNPKVQDAIRFAGKEILKGVGLGAGYEVLHKLVD